MREMRSVGERERERESRIEVTSSLSLHNDSFTLFLAKIALFVPPLSKSQMVTIDIVALKSIGDEFTTSADKNLALFFCCFVPPLSICATNDPPQTIGDSDCAHAWGCSK